MTMTPFAVRINVAGRDLATSANDLREGVPAVIDGLSFQWGRETRLDQPAPGSLTATLLVPTESAAAALAHLDPGARVIAYTSYSDNAGVGIVEYPDPQFWKALTTGDRALVAPAPMAESGQLGDQWSGLGRYDPGAPFPVRFEYRVVRAFAPATMVARPVYFRTIRDAHPAYGPWAPIPSEVGRRHTIGPNESTRIPLDPSYSGCFVGFELQCVQAGSSRLQDHANRLADHTEPLSNTEGISIESGIIYTPRPMRREFTIFSGRVMSAPITWDTARGLAKITMTANEWTVAVKNTTVGETPWPPETTFARLSRITQAAGIRRSVGTGIAVETVAAARDVDARPALDLIHEYATARGTVAWPSYNDTFGEFFQFEAEDSRLGLLRLNYEPDGTAYISVKQGERGTWKALALDASAIRADGITVDRDVATLATTVRVACKKVRPPQEGGPSIDSPEAYEDHEVVVSDDGRFATFGAHEVQVNAGILDKSDTVGYLFRNGGQSPEDLARLILTRSAPGQWKITGMTVDTRVASVSTSDLRRLLEISKRPGLPILLTSLPEWMPGAPSIPVYLEGSRASYERNHWAIDLTITHASAQAGAVTLAQTTPHILTDFRNLTLADMATAYA
jgi:hypothetical protein